MSFGSLVLAGIAFCAAVSLMGLIRLRSRMRGLRADLAASATTARAESERAQALIRHMRLAAHDIRATGMSVHGHGDHLAAAQHADAPGIATCAADLLDLADSLQTLTLEQAGPRQLREEVLPVGLAIDEAIAVVNASILPGRRNWRVQPELRPIGLRGDRRALRHAISRVLADAVRNTRHDDWIDIGGGRQGEELILTIADEGKGIATPEAAAVRRDSRGVGTRLALARLLVEAHDGRMQIEAWAGVGSRVALIFPATRLMPVLDGEASLPSHSYAGPAPALSSAGR